MHYEGAYYHVTARGNNKQDIFRTPEEFERLKRYLGETLRATRSNLYAYALMNNHLHLLIQVAFTPLSDIMHGILSRYSHWFNWRNNRVRHVFERRYHPVLCDTDAYFMELLRYIHLNPVHAGMVKDPSHWRWSGHAEIMGDSQPELLDRDFVLGMFDGNPSDYLEFLKGRMSDPTVPERAIGKPLSARIIAPPPLISLEQLAASVCGKKGVSLDQMRGKGRRSDLVAARHDFILECAKGGVKPSEIADFLKISRSGVSMALRRVSEL